MNSVIRLSEIERELIAARDTITEMEETIRQLRAALAPAARLPLEWPIRPAGAVLFRALLGVEMLTRDAAMQALYGTRPDDAPDQKTLDVHICNLRRDLRPFGVTIRTVWGQGWSLDHRAAWRERLGVGK